MPKLRIARRTDARNNRERLLDAARSVLAERGFDADVTEITARAGVGAGTLYRHFDEWGDLLYVGISLSPIARLRQHRRSAHWMEEIVRVEIEWHPSRREALAREREAIEREDPKHNIDGKPRVRRAI